MTRTTSRAKDDRAGDPTRFAEARMPPRQSRRPLEVLGAVAALGLLLVGLPVALVLLSGPPPIPTSLPSLTDAARQLSMDDLLTVLVAVVWLAWVWFVVCVVVEAVAARRGGLARTVPLAGPLQHLARVLIGVLLMSGIVAGPAQAATSAADHVSPSTRVVMVDSSLQQTSVVAGVDQAGAASQADREHSPLVGKKVYTVKAPKAGYHDNLWDIAERHLGDGRRYQEIYHLNKDREQPDGGQVELARLIHPGWELVMPEDAVGVERVAAPAPAPVEAPPMPMDTPAPVDDAAETGGAEGGADGAGGAVETASVFSDSVRSYGGIGLLAAGVLGALALQRRRQRGTRASEDARAVEAHLRVSATTDRVRRLDHALRTLTATCRTEGAVPPPAYAAFVDDESVELMLAPAQPKPFTGWEAVDDGARWRSTADPRGSVPAESAPYPGLVGLGVDGEGRDVLIDLEAAGGVVSLVGDVVTAEQVAAAMALQAATAPWADAVRVSISDLPDEIATLVEGRVRVTDLAQEIGEVEQFYAGRTDDVLTGRMRRRGLFSHLVVAGRVPDASIAERLGALVGGGRRTLSIVVVGEHRDSRWQLHVDENGTLSAPQLGLTVDANRVTAAQVSAVAELFEASRTADRPDDGLRIRVSAPEVTHDDAAWATAQRRIGVLGRLAVQGAGQIAADRRPLAEEMVVHLALHREGVHPTVLAAALWPRGVTADVRDSAVERARGWLGSDVDGSHLLQETADGRLRLADSVVCDWDCARTLFLRSRTVSSEREEVEMLRRGLQLVRGEAFSGTPQGRFAWVSEDDLPREIARVVVDAADRLATLLGEDDPSGASDAAAAGLRAWPTEQRLWRAMVRSRHAMSGVAGVMQTVEAMIARMDGVPLEAETEALLDELMPTGSGGTLAGAN
ncbi:hypothetical protein [Mumia zhuanghuii]|uniref:hypothetical protein n=1 Tax=Mumia zhuanghuii TaxID=2585211 RepID=UPI0036282826